MIIRTISAVFRKQPPLHFKPLQSFIIMKLLKKKFEEKEQLHRVKPQTYSANTRKQSPEQEEESDDWHGQPEYDFFSRQRDIELSKDFKKIRENSQFIPEEVGRGGFDEVVYWSQNAQTPEQIINMMKVFNRVEVPEVVEDAFHFQQFGSKVLETVFLATNLNDLAEFATFGQKYSIEDELYWRKIQDKTLKIFPKTPEQVKDSINVIFVMSKCGQGDLIFSAMASIFNQAPLDVSDASKLLIAYYNLQDGDKQFIRKMFNKITSDIESLPKQILVELLHVFKESKLFSSEHEKVILRHLAGLVAEFELVELCMAAEYVGHNKMDQEFWSSVEERAEALLEGKKVTSKMVIWLMDLLSSYSISTDFVRKHFIDEIRKDKFRALDKHPAHILSRISKTLYIYELEHESKDIEEYIETRIIREFNDLKNVRPENLLSVILDYTVTRNGSRELYIFLEEVVQALFEDFKKNRDLLEKLHKMYDRSNLCSAGLLEKIDFYLA